jgi:hypothetical protein
MYHTMKETDNNITNEEKDNNIDWKLWRPRLIYFLVVTALGMLAMNQFLSYYYSAQLLRTPCNLCADLNPDMRSCLVQKQALYKDFDGKWSTLDSQYGKYKEPSVNLSDVRII